MQSQNPYQQPPQSPYQAGYQQPPQSPYQAQPQLRYIGFWWRALAFLIDMVVLSIVYYTILVHVSASITSIISLVYLIVLEAIFGATVGKLVLGLRVRKLDGSPIGWKEAVIRNLILCVEEFTIFIVTFITINKSPIRQRWGDRVAGTVVVKI
jgi:uncharacterized RDD family membrane protein YckC